MLFRAMISLTDVGLLCSTTRPGIKRFFCRPHSPPTPTPLEALRAVTLLYFESAVRSTSCLHGHPTLEGHSNRVVKSSGQHCVSKSLRVGNEESGRIWSEVQVFEELMIDSSPPPASKVNHVGVFAIHLAEPSCERPRERGCAIMFTSYIFLYYRCEIADKHCWLHFSRGPKMPVWTLTGWIRSKREPFMCLIFFKEDIFDYP